MTGHHDRPSASPAMARALTSAARVTEPGPGWIGKLVGSVLSDLVPPYIVNAAHHLIGVNGHTYELALRRAEESPKVRMSRQVRRNVCLSLLFRSLDRPAKRCQDEPPT